VINLEAFGDSAAMSKVGELLDEFDGVSRVRLVPAARAGQWDSLLAAFGTTPGGIGQAFETVTADRLAALHKPESRRPRGMQLHFLQFHEAYHVGQIGLMRRVVGKPGAI